MADLAALRELYAWMRAEGVPYARCGELELRLGPSPAPSLGLVAEPPASPETERRRELEMLLHSSGADITPFLGRPQ